MSDDEEHYGEGEVPNAFDDPDPGDRERSDPDGGDGDLDPDDPDMGDLYDELAELEDLVDSPEERRQVRDAMELAAEVRSGSTLGRIVHGFDGSDVAEAVLGSLLFGIPMFVEGGTEEVGRFVAARPPFLAFTLAVGVTLVISILYVADIQDVRVKDPYFRLIPRKFAGVVTVSFLTAAIMMTAWGRVDWAEPWLAFCQVSVAFVPMAIGAALGDILPG